MVASPKAVGRTGHETAQSSRARAPSPSEASAHPPLASGREQSEPPQTQGTALARDSTRGNHAEHSHASGKGAVGATTMSTATKNDATHRSPSQASMAAPVVPSTSASPAPLRRRTTPLFNPTGLGDNDGDADEAETSAPGTVSSGKSQSVSESAIPEASNAETNAREDLPPLQEEAAADRRGRRRRSSERAHDAVPSSVTSYSHSQALTVDDLQSKELSGPPSDKQESPVPSTSAEAQLWWQRGGTAANSSDSPASLAASATNSPASNAAAHVKAPLTIDAHNARVRQRETSTETSSQSPSARSPAAAFLSSMNERLASPSSAGSTGARNMPLRGYSMSPQRSADSVRFSQSSLPNTEGRPRQSLPQGDLDESISSLGLAGAAAQLYGSETRGSYDSHVPQQSPPGRLDEEGAYFGPDQRYRLGRTIGFGGFSTIREAWDTSAEDGSTANGQAKLSEGVQQDWHRVAVKIVYTPKKEVDKRGQEANGNAQQSREVGAENGVGEGAEDEDEDGGQELEIWKTMPAHPNLLPLLYHEQVHSDEGLLDFLVMPFCEGNLLSFVRKAGSFGNGAPETPVLSRAGSTRSIRAGYPSHRSLSRHSIADSVSSSIPSATLSQFNRTGSGFVPHTRQAGSISERIVSVPLSALLARSNSMAGSAPEHVSQTAPVYSGASGHARQSSLRMRASQSAATTQSRGISMESARDVMQQLTEALICLQEKASVLHGDIKLENVLGQQWLVHTIPDEQPSDEAVQYLDSGSFGSPRLRQESDASQASHKEPGNAPANLSTSTCWRLADFGLAKNITSTEDGVLQREGHAMARMAYVVRQARVAHEHETNPGTEAAMARTQSTSSNSQRQSRLGGGSLAYKAPEAFYDLDEVSTELIASPFASDMWALGCILYALFAGRLPFVDQFEPRLQTKIARGQWDMPDRLQRRTERLNSATAARANARQTSSFGASSGSDTRPISLQMSVDMRAAAADLSASLPALPAQQQENEGAESLPHTSSMQSVVVYNDEEGGLDQSRTMDEHEDPESDDDAGTSGMFANGMNGTSRERIAVRRALRGLLEPDPRKRWTVQQLASSDWIKQDALEPKGIEPHSHAYAALNASTARESRSSLAPAHNEDLPRSLQDVLEGPLSRNGEDDAADDIAGPLPTAFRDPSPSVADADMLHRRGRAPRRADIESDSPRARPIAIDRSKSRSRSRADSFHGEESAQNWDLDMPPAMGGFHSRQQQRSGANSAARGEPEHDSRGRPRATVRSSSVNVHYRSQSRTSSREQGATLLGGRKSSRSASRSASRSRRLELEQIMPQLALQRNGSGQLAGSGHHTPAQDDVTRDPGRSTSREASTSPVLRPQLHVQHDEHSASRTSIWKSPLRARDRLMHMMGGLGGNTSGTSSSNNSNNSHCATPDDEGK